MGTLDQAVKRTVVADVVRAGDKMIIPEGMSAKEALDLLERRVKFEEEKVILRETFDCFPWDGAVALERVLTQQYGWAATETVVQEFFGMKFEKPPVLMTVEVAYGKTQAVPWGRFVVPRISGYLETGVDRKESGRLVFLLTATIKRKDEFIIKALFAKIGEEIREHSIYRGKAIKLRFRDGDGDEVEMPTPVFMDTEHIDENQLVFSKTVQDAVNTNLFTPIRRAHDCIANKIPLKRGVLLGGIFGTGKTLAASVASKLAVDAGITYIYAERADELGDAIEFAKQYQSPAAVVFVEDIDRTVSGARSTKMDTVLNVIDGIDSKRNNIIVVLTTNAMHDINTAMLRPGRLDAVIDITPPDSEAVERLLRNYGGAMIHVEADLTEVGRVLQGNIPAVIAEVVKRAKLSQLALQAPGSKIKEISPQALLESARTMQMQIELLKGKQPDADTTPLENRVMALVQKAVNADGAEVIHKTHRNTKLLTEKFDLS